MPVNHIELLEAANLINEIKGDEAHLRSCVSRYYYSGYHAAKYFHGNLTTPGTNTSGVGSHQNFIHQLSKPTIGETDPKYLLSIEVSKYLQRCLFNRRTADYTLDQPLTTKNVNIVRSHIDLIFETIQ